MSRNISCVLALAGMVAGTLSLAACGDVNPGPTNPDTPDTVDPDATYAAGGNFDLPIDRIWPKRPVPAFEHVIVGPGPIDEPIADSPDLRDETQVLQVLLALHSGERALVEQVLPRLRATQARDFALMIHHEHGAALADMRRVRERHDIVLEPSDVSLALRRRSIAETKLLLEARSGDVDELFIARQVGAHTRALFIIDELLLPATKKGDVLALLERTRDMVVRHRQLARRLHLIARDGGLHDGPAPM